MISLQQDNYRQIMLELDYATIKNACSSNKSLNNVCNDNSFWYDKIVKDFGPITIIGTNYKNEYEKLYNQRYTFIDNSVVPFDPDERMKQMLDIYIGRSRVRFHGRYSSQEAQNYKNTLIRYKQFADKLYNNYITSFENAIDSGKKVITFKLKMFERGNEDEYMFLYNAWYLFLYYLLDNHYSFKEESKQLEVADAMEGTLYIWHFVVNIKL